MTTYIKYRKIEEVTNIANTIIDDDSFNDIDNVILSCAKWLERQFKKGKFSYKTDKAVHKVPEYWQTPEETLKLKTGDCDDYMILQYYIIREVLKQLNVWEKCEDRLFCADGGVNRYGIYPDQKQRHAYNIWKAFSDDEYYVVETTYHRKMAIDNFLKKSHRINTMYNYMRYIWTDEKMYLVHAFRDLKN